MSQAGVSPWKSKEQGNMMWSPTHWRSVCWILLTNSCWCREARCIVGWMKTVSCEEVEILLVMWIQVRIFIPIHILDNKVSVSDIDGLKIFKLYEHPEIRPQIEVMKTEVIKYQTLADSIKSFEERKDINGKDTFDLSDWWKANYETLPKWIHVRCVQCWPTHPNLVLLRVSLVSSMRLTMTIRSRHTPTTFNCRCSCSLTNEVCSSRVSR